MQDGQAKDVKVGFGDILAADLVTDDESLPPEHSYNASSGPSYRSLWESEIGAWLVDTESRAQGRNVFGGDITKVGGTIEVGLVGTHADFDISVDALLQAANAADLSAIKSPPEDHLPAMTTTQGRVGGDRLFTAPELVRECGLKPNGVMEGPVFRSLSTAEMAAVVPHLHVLTQSSPEDKRLLVERLKSLGWTIAVTGSMNDVPSLGTADVGFSMGVAGTAVAKEAAQIVLMDDSFGSIITALEWGRAVNTAVWKFLQPQLSVNVAAALLYLPAIASGNLMWMLMARTAWWCICINNIMNIWSERRGIHNPDWSTWIPSGMRSLKADQYLGGHHKRRHRFQSQHRSWGFHAGSQASVTNCFGQLAIDLPWMGPDWLQHICDLKIARTGPLHLSGARLHSTCLGEISHDNLLASYQKTSPSKMNMCYLAIGLAQFLPRNLRQLSLMMAAALLLVVPPAAAWTREQTVFVLDVCVGAVAGTSAITVAVLRTKGQDPEAKWWISAYSFWAVAFTLALVEALLKPSVLGRRKAFLCATFLLAAHLNRSLGGQGSSALDTVLTYGPMWLVVSLYLMTVLVDSWPDIVRATIGV